MAFLTHHQKTVPKRTQVSYLQCSSAFRADGKAKRHSFGGEGVVVRGQEGLVMQRHLATVKALFERVSPFAYNTQAES